MANEFSEEIQRELLRIAQLPTEEQVAAYRALHDLLEKALNESN
jgi:hypothetical protein